MAKKIGLGGHPFPTDREEVERKKERITTMSGKKGRQSGKSSRQHTSKAAKQQAREAVDQHDSKPVDRVKATFYLSREDVINLEKIRLSILSNEGRKVDKSELVRQAIGLLVKQHDSKT